MRFLDRSAVLGALSPTEAIDVLEGLFAAEELPRSPLRTIHRLSESAQLLLMPSAGPDGAGVKVITVVSGNPDRGLPLIDGLYLLLEPETYRPRLVLDGAALTSLRTGALSGLATRYLARPDSSKLVVFGAGAQARIHIEMMAAVRPIESVAVVAPSGRRVEEALEVARNLGLGAERAGPEAVAQADIVCTCTTSPTPVFEGSLLPPGVHINAVGAFSPQTRELDSETVKGAKIVVEDREVALEEAGDLLIPLAEGCIGAADIVAELGDLAKGRVARQGAGDRTVFKAVGAAFEDLALALAIAEA